MHSSNEVRIRWWTGNATNLSQISFLNNFLQEDTEAPSQPSSSLHKVLEALPIPFAQQSGLAEF